MDSFKQIQSFVNVATKGSLSAAARMEGVTPAVIGRRIDALEQRLGVRLLTRTTRHVALSFEGSAFLEDCQRILHDLANAEASVSLGGVKASGHIRVTAPAGFGREYIAPLIQRFLSDNPEVTCSLDLSDRVVDLVNEGFDCGVRIGGLPDSSLVSLRLGRNARVVVGSPDYLLRAGTPVEPGDLAAHECLTLAHQGAWLFNQTGKGVSMRVAGRFECNDGAILRRWALEGLGLAWRSLWEVGADLRAGRLVSVLDDFATEPTGIYAVFPQRRHLPLRVRLLLDFFKNGFGGVDS